MLRRMPPVFLAILVLAALAAPVAAAPGHAGPARDAAAADHLGGTFDICGRITAFTPPAVATPGSLTVAGIDDGADHVFPIAETAVVDPLIAGLAAAGEWSCLELVGDGMGVIESVAVGSTTLCGPLSVNGGIFALGPNVTHPETTVTLDGDAGTLLAADAELLALLEGVTTVQNPDLVCLDFLLAADGTLATLLVDYRGLVACGMVTGTQLQYRDPASQPYPEGTTVSVAGFTLDASLFEGPHLDVLAFHLDLVAEVCLFTQIVDSVLVRAASRSFQGTEACGELEVVGGLVFVNAIVVSQGLTGINFADPSSASIAQACWSASAAPAGVTGLLTICGSYEGATDTTFTVSGVTFHLETSIEDANQPAAGGPQAVALIGPDPFEPFGAGNPALVTTASLPGCAGAPASPTIPDTSAGEPGGAMPAGLLALLGAAWLMGALALATARVRRR